MAFARRIGFVFLMSVALTSCAERQAVRAEASLSPQPAKGYPSDFGPIVSWADGAARRATVAFYTLSEEAAGVSLSTAFTNFELLEKISSNWHRFSFDAPGGFSYRLISRSSNLHDRGGKVTSPAGLPIRFIVCGEADPSIAEAMRISGAKFCLLTGGLGGKDAGPGDWVKMLKIGAQWMDTTAVLPVPFFNDLNADARSRLLRETEEGPAVLETPGIRIVMLGTPEFPEPGSPGFVRFTNALDSGAKWRMALVYGSLFPSTGSNLPASKPGAAAALLSEINRLSPALVFSGQEKLYSRSESGGTTFINAGGLPDQEQQVILTNAFTEKLVCGQPHYCTVDVSERRILVNVYNEKNQLLDHREIIE